MRCKKQMVSLSCVDTDDSTYRITTETALDDLIVSIDRTGLIHAPFLVENQPSIYIPVSGFRRICACRQLNWSCIEANIIEAETEPLIPAKLAIADNSLQRPLNIIEQSRAYQLLYRCIDDDEMVVKIARELKLQSSASLIRKIKPLCSLSPSVQDGILSDAISMPVAIEMKDLEADATESFARLFNQLRISLSKQRQLLSMAKEIASREIISVADVICDDDIQAVLADSHLDRPQKAARILFILKKRRFPEITRKEQEFEHNIQQLKLGQHIKLIPPAHFEGPAYTLSMQFNGLDELKDRMIALERILNHPALIKILN